MMHGNLERSPQKSFGGRNVEGLPFLVTEDSNKSKGMDLHAGLICTRPLL